MILQLVLHNNHNIFMALQSSCGCNILHKVVERRSPACSSTCNAGAMTMFNITDDNNVSDTTHTQYLQGGETSNSSWRTNSGQRARARCVLSVYANSVHVLIRRAKL